MPYRQLTHVILSVVCHCQEKNLVTAGLFACAAQVVVIPVHLWPRLGNPHVLQVYPFLGAVAVLGFLALGFFGFDGGAPVFCLPRWTGKAIVCTLHGRRELDHHFRPGADKDVTLVGYFAEF